MAENKSEVVFCIWDNGDPTTGFYGMSSTVTISDIIKPVDKEWLEATRQALKKCFSLIHDNTIISVFTEEEVKQQQSL